ncbi:MAG: hypothetical protein K2M43_03435 [Mycoplasmoidaceae bacterium]|nr:hypothetical protein [Mycoplasmoidaceae bacterium]
MKYSVAFNPQPITVAIAPPTMAHLAKEIKIQSNRMLIKLQKIAPAVTMNCFPSEIINKDKNEVNIENVVPALITYEYKVAYLYACSEEVV